MEIKIFKACCKKYFNNNRYFLVVGVEYNCCQMLKKRIILVTSDGVNEIFSLDRFYEHFYTEKEYRKLKLQKLNEI